MAFKFCIRPQSPDPPAAKITASEHDPQKYNGRRQSFLIKRLQNIYIYNLDIPSLATAVSYIFKNFSTKHARFCLIKLR